ncbi:hypothetical protein CBS147339_1457 [Penicillium roqueforti]|nr:hypothetical protein CBS147339_1457 [Penicillium roqueforti]KAI3108180.1 hypothetical protein CBS147338_42 [Penicillium roqueforti]KAI3153846.1 hypothetical protein CBS147325_938 [Penicillium roqueforti]KAI3175872.1 hypothetical protein DTO046C5_2555 [Penicillium roqueforti]KAI3191400.1 hypothetical protein DTO032C6_1130 [Penicillium roqueforti]
MRSCVDRFLSYRMIPQSDWPTLDDIRKPRSISLWGVWQVTDANLIESASDGLPLPVTCEREEQEMKALLSGVVLEQDRQIKS